MGAFLILLGVSAVASFFLIALIFGVDWIYGGDD